MAMIEIPEDETAFPAIRSRCLEATREFFSASCPLQDAEAYGGRPYERRVQQEEMAVAVATAFEKSGHLCVEAPTGVGKSFAYLTPAIHQALSRHRGVLVTTETINLQEQLVRKDLPLLRAVMKVKFTFALAAGRANYLCRRRLALALGEFRDEFLPSADLESEAQKLADWAETSESGFYSDLPFKPEHGLWNCVCSEAASCSAAECRFFRSCFYWRARREWDKADILVTNHALFFTDLRMRALEKQESTPLPDYAAVVFDEAHTLEDNAAKHLGLHLTSGGVRYVLNRLFNPRNGRGLLVRPGENSLAMRAFIASLHDRAADFFNQFAQALEPLDEKYFRIYKPGKFTDTLSGPLGDLERRIREYIAEQDNPEFAAELGAQLDRCTAIREGIGEFIRMEDAADSVYWAEGRLLPRGPGMSVELCSAPLNVAEILARILFTPNFPVVLTSATLAVNGKLDFYLARIGFRNGEKIILNSPFDYWKQVKLYLAKSLPAPSEEGFTAAATAAIGDFVQRTGGHAFVLFTSYGMLRTCAERLAPLFREHHFKLLVHGDELSRTAMLDEFKRSRSAVIFGTSSFWTGVDVPGDALKNVIITKLPFEVPSHPLAEARCERIRKTGFRPFESYSLPNAVLRFRQGIGRLIRSRSDSGIIVVLDSRVSAKYYGRSFLNSIPRCPVEYF